MNNRKMLWPYITELVTFLFVAGLAFVAVFAFHMISVKWSPLTVGLILAIVLWLLHYVRFTAAFSVKVLLDCATGSFETVEARYVEQTPFRYSPYHARKKADDADKQTEDSLYFRIRAERGREEMALTASCYFPLEARKKYRFTIGKRSKAVVSIDNCLPNTVKENRG